MDIFKLLALKGASKILIALYENDLLIYSQLVEIVGYSTTTNRAIKKLIEFRLIKRRVLDERYRPVAYSLTETGRKLSEIIMQLMDFEKRLKASAQKSS